MDHGSSRQHFFSLTTPVGVQAVNTTHPPPVYAPYPVTTMPELPRAAALVAHNNNPVGAKPLADATNQQQQQSQPQVEMTALRSNDHPEDNRRIQGGAIKKQRTLKTPPPTKAAVIGALMYPDVHENDNHVQHPIAGQQGKKPEFPWQQVKPQIKTMEEDIFGDLRTTTRGDALERGRQRRVIADINIVQISRIPSQSPRAKRSRSADSKVATVSEGTPNGTRRSTFYPQDTHLSLIHI